MEPTAAWPPYEFQLANWTVQEPAASLAVEYASIDMPATWGLQAYIPESSQGLQQLVEYYSYNSAASRHNATGEKAMISNDSHASDVVKKVMAEFKDHIDTTEAKMHRYLASLGAVDKSHTVPRIVAIGPYHGLDHLKPAEMVKHAAACHCVVQSSCLLEDLYGAVIPVADRVRGLYDKDVMAGIGYQDFRHMMFFDACFLVQYMLMRSDRDRLDASLLGFLSPNRIDIFHDVMLLENQIPWVVVETVIGCTRMPSIPKHFVRAKRHCMLPDDQDEPPEPKPFNWNNTYKPPHLLGLLRNYIVGTNDIHYPESTSKPKIKSTSVSAIKLAEIGITLSANKTTELIDMRLNENVFAELCLPSLSLDRDRASYLVNMAALELCTVKSFSRAKHASDSAVCSYLLLLAMLVYREEDVHVLRVKGLLVGGGGLTNAEALRFFTIFQRLRYGQHYKYIMKNINNYRERRRARTMLHAFFYNNWKIITAVIGVVSTVAGIIWTLLSIKASI